MSRRTSKAIIACFSAALLTAVFVATPGAANSEAHAARHAAISGKNTQIAGVLLPKRTKLVINYKRVRLA